MPVNCISATCLIGGSQPNKLDSGRVRSGLLGRSSTFPTSSASLNDALWMIWARWRPRWSRAFSLLRDDFLWSSFLPLVLFPEAASSAASAGGFRSRSGLRFPGRTFGKRHPRPPLLTPLPPLAFSLSDSDPGEMTTPSSCRLAARGGGRYWMALLPL